MHHIIDSLDSELADARSIASLKVYDLNNSESLQHSSCELIKLRNYHVNPACESTAPIDISQEHKSDDICTRAPNNARRSYNFKIVL